nr:hypothetical protein [Tanacetum cinerariifolium]
LYGFFLNRTMDTTIDQQVAMDEALVPHARRLRIGRSNSRLLSDISSKESTLQLVYDATATVCHHSIQFKMDNKKHIVNLEYFREMLHIYPRLPGQSFVEPPFEEEILAFLRFLRHNGAIRKLTDPAVISGSNSLGVVPQEECRLRLSYVGRLRLSEMITCLPQSSWYPDIRTRNSSVPCCQNANIRNSDAYKEYYAVATRATPPKPKASVWKTKSSSDTTITSLTAATGPRLSTSAKGKQPATTSKAKSLSALSEVAMTEAQQLKLATKKSLWQTHISQASGSGVYEGTGTIPGVLDVPTDESVEEISWNSTDEEGDDGEEGNDNDDDDAQDDDDQEDKRNDEDDQEEGNDDEQAFDEEEFIHPSLSTHAKEETRDEESFDPIPKTPENTDDEGNSEENLRMNFGREEGQDEENEEDELYRDVNINLGRGIQMGDVHTTQEFKDSHVTLTLVNPDGQQQSSSMSSQFVTTMLNPTPDARIELRDEAQKENYEFLKTIDENMQKIIKKQVKEQVKTSYVVAADLSEMELKKILIKKMEGNKSIHRSNEQRNLYKALVEAYESDKIILDTYGDIATLKRRRDDDADKDKEPSTRSDRGSKRRREGKEPESTSAPKRKATRSASKSTQSIQPWISELAKQSDSHSSFNEFMDTSIDFSTFLMNRLKVDTLTPKLIAGPTYELMKGSSKSLVELKFFLEEVYKATTDQLDWVNPEGQQYPHNLLKPLPLIPNSRGHRVIQFDHFINNDLKYLCGGASSRKLRQACPLGNLPLGAQTSTVLQFAVNRESARDVYSKRRIIVVTELKIVEWHNYKHLDWIMVCRDDDKLYKFKEGDFKRLRIQDIEDMLLLHVQGKLTNLTVKERFAFNVYLRMFTRSIVIQRRVEDLQLGVKSYQKKLNLTRPDTYHSDLKRKEPYIAFSNRRGFIYQNKDKQNRLMWIDELHKFSDGTLIDVRTALDDRPKGIRIKYLPQTIWRKSDKERAAVMIQAIDKKLKTRRIMRSLERFVGGRQYEGDNRILQRTI